MAKVEGPLFSLGARGKIADAMVFFPWKGRHVVRRWLKPTNPQSTMQSYVRASLKAIGKFIGGILCISKGSALDSLLYADATSSVDAGMNWNAWLGEGFLDALMSGNAFNTASFDGYISEYSTDIHTTIKAAYDLQATVAGLEDFAMAYGYTTSIPAGLQLYFGAIACWKKTVSAGSPFNVAPVSWAVADPTSLVDAMTSDA